MRAYCETSRGLRRLAGLVVAGLLSTTAQADLVVPSGGAYSLNGGSTDLGCTDLIVSGTLQLDSGNLTGVRNVVIQAGGSVSATTGTLSLSGSWSNSGSFVGGNGLVSFVDLAGCSPTGGTISGNTTFSRLSFISAIGKTYQLVSGSTQTITQQFVVQGAPTLPLVLRGATPGLPAYLSVASGQSIAFFGAADLVGSVAWIAPNQTNAINGTGVVRIFGDPNPAIPTLPLAALILLALGLATLGRGKLRSSA